MRRLSAFFAVLVIACNARSDWTIVSAANETAPVAGIQHRRLTFQGSVAEATIDVALFSTNRATLRVVDNGQGDQSLANAMSRLDCVAGVNGGYFDPEFRPIGLRIVNGTATSPFTRARLLTGVLCASQGGVQIFRTGEFRKGRKLDSALECGPMLVDSGVPVRTLERTRAARRTFAAVSRSDKAAVGVTSDLTLADLAEALSKISGDLRIWRAMNLDGGSSTAFWFRRDGPDPLSIPEQKTVRDFVAVVSR